MLAKNLVHEAILAGHAARFLTAADMIRDLTRQDTTALFAVSSVTRIFDRTVERISKALRDPKLFVSRSLCSES